VPVLALPLAALLPLQLPPAVHVVGLLVEDQVMVAEPPTVIEMGLIDKFTTGAGGATTCRGMLLA
jgi:hypothetical protein